MSEVNVDKGPRDAVKRGSVIPAVARGAGGADPRVMRELRLAISKTVNEYQLAVKRYDGDVVGFRVEMRSFINSLERLYKQWVLFENL